MTDPSLEEIIATQAITATYQPIVELDTGRVVAYEALARGPHGTVWESPAEMFATAARRNLTTELDWACRAAAIHGALEAGLGRDTSLFINVEPSTLAAPPPKQFADLFELAAATLSIVVEVTERSVVRDPASLVGMLADMRSLGLGVAIDDVGADPGSLALLPFVAPDVIKLDMSLVHRHADREIAYIAGAARADAERRQAWILAEGIETQEHLDRAFVLGARLGQGWLFAQPGPLPTMTPHRRRHDDLIFRLSGTQSIPTTPWSLVASSNDRRIATKRLLMPMSRYIEQRAFADEPRIILGAFQTASHFTGATRHRYERLATRNSLVGAIATEMNRSPGTGVRSGTLPFGHPLTGEWAVTVVGPHDAAALIARERTDQGTGDSDTDRAFDYVITHDRETVIAAARSLMQYIEPT